MSCASDEYAWIAVDSLVTRQNGSRRDNNQAFLRFDCFSAYNNARTATVARRTEYFVHGDPTRTMDVRPTLYCGRSTVQCARGGKKTDKVVGRFISRSTNALLSRFSRVSRLNFHDKYKKMCIAISHGCHVIIIVMSVGKSFYFFIPSSRYADVLYGGWYATIQQQVITSKTNYRSFDVRAV